MENVQLQFLRATASPLFPSQLAKVFFRLYIILENQYYLSQTVLAVRVCLYFKDRSMVKIPETLTDKSMRQNNSNMKL